MKNNKTLKLIITLGLIAILATFTVMFTGCINHANEGRYFDVDGWTLFQFNRSNRPWSRRVNIVHLNNQSLVVDGVLTIPTRVGNHDIWGFGGGMRYPSFYPGQGVTKIIVPKELNVNRSFWAGSSLEFLPNLRYVEFLCDTFERIDLWGGGGCFIYIYNS